MYPKKYILPLLSIMLLLIVSHGALGQKTIPCDTIELSDLTIYVTRGAKDSYLQVFKRQSDGQQIEAPLYVDRVWTRGVDGLGNWQRVRSISTQDDKVSKAKRVSRTIVGDLSHSFVCSFGFDAFTAPEWSDKIHFWGSTSYSLGYQAIFPIGRTPWALNTGLSLTGSSFSLGKHYMMQRNLSGHTVLQTDPSGMGYAQSRLDLIYLEMPIGLSLSWGETNLWSSLFVVPKILCLQKSRTCSLDERVHTLVSDDLNVRPYSVDLRAEIGYSLLGLFGRISLLNTIPPALAEVSTRDYTLGLVFRF